MYLGSRLACSAFRGVAGNTLHSLVSVSAPTNSLAPSLWESSAQGLVSPINDRRPLYPPNSTFK